MTITTIAAHRGSVASRPRARVAGQLVLSFVAAFSTISCRAAESELPRSIAHESTRLLQDSTGTGVVIFVNPINCTLSGEDAARLNALPAKYRIPVRLALVGLGPEDTVTAVTALRDLGLTLPYVLYERDRFKSLASSEQLANPLIVMLRQHSVSLVVTNVTTERAVAVLLASLSLSQ